MTGLTGGTLLNGRVRYTQAAEGYRTGLEPVLLAACIPARPGQSVLEAGAGAGAGMLCLMARVPGLLATCVELDPPTAALARANMAANGFDARVWEGDVADAGTVGLVDHAFANPPWHDPAGTLPPQADRARAKHLSATGLQPWIDGMAAALLPRGTLSLALAVALLTEAAAGLARAGFGRVDVFPLWPRAGVAAKLVLLRARRGRASTRMLPGLVLHQGSGFTQEADAVLRDGSAIGF